MARMKWDAPAEYEYLQAADPEMPAVPIGKFPAALHQTGPSRIVHFDHSKELKTDYPQPVPTASPAMFVSNRVPRLRRTSRQLHISSTYCEAAERLHFRTALSGGARATSSRFLLVRRSRFERKPTRQCTGSMTVRYCDISESSRNA